MSSPERTRPRLPLHPRPRPDEALSSWMWRLARTYGLSDALFQQAAFGVAPLGDATLDLDPSAGLIAALAERTGVEPERIRAMTLAGYVPRLLDAVEPVPDLLGAYVSQFGLLLPPESRRRELPPRFSASVPWIADDLLHDMPLGCPRCLAADEEPYLRIRWRASWMASCPVHGVLLERVVVGLRRFHGPADGRPAPPMLIAIDGLTHQAVTTGTVVRAGDVVDAGVWMRRLRTLLDELVRPIKLLGDRKAMIGAAWKQAGLSFAARGSFVLTPFERLSPERRALLLTMAGAVIQRGIAQRTMRDPGPLSASSHNQFGSTFMDHRQDDGFRDNKGQTTTGWP